MFERFTAAARTVVVGAQEHARRAGDNHIGTDHLLLGCLDDDELGRLTGSTDLDADGVRRALDRLRAERGGMDPAALRGLGIDLDEVRRKVEDRFGEGALDDPTPTHRHPRFPWQRDVAGHIPFTAEAKAALERSLRVSQDLAHHHIGAEHILLALLHPESGIAHRAIDRSGTEPATLSRTLRERIRDSA
ncbi:Clp protease N-terminal domain-containing protein [Propionibacteriaceae bacterium Y2011]